MSNLFGLGLSGLSKQLDVCQNQKVIKFNSSIYWVIGFQSKKPKTDHQSSLGNYTCTLTINLLPLQITKNVNFIL